MMRIATGWESHHESAMEGMSRTLPCEVGVQQGDNMAPLLFIFFVNAFVLTLEKAWPVRKPSFRDGAPLGP